MSRKYDFFEGNELISKVVRSGNSAKVCVPKKWLDKKVKVSLVKEDD